MRRASSWNLCARAWLKAWRTGGDEFALREAIRLFIHDHEYTLSRDTRDEIRTELLRLQALVKTGRIQQAEVPPPVKDRKTAKRILSRLLVPEYEGRGIKRSAQLTDALIVEVCNLSNYRDKRSFEKQLRDDEFVSSVMARLRLRGYSDEEIDDLLTNHQESIMKAFWRRSKSK